jgi:hypothetical protein
LTCRKKLRSTSKWENIGWLALNIKKCRLFPVKFSELVLINSSYHTGQVWGCKWIKPSRERGFKLIGSRNAATAQRSPLRGSVEGKSAIEALSHKSYIRFLCLCVLAAELLQIIVFFLVKIVLPLKKAIEKIEVRL